MEEAMTAGRLSQAPTNTPAVGPLTGLGGQGTGADGDSTGLSRPTGPPGPECPGWPPPAPR